MPLFGVSNGVMWSIINRIAGGFKSVGFRYANCWKDTVRKLGRCMGAGTVLELSALPNLQEQQKAMTSRGICNGVLCSACIRLAGENYRLRYPLS